MIVIADDITGAAEIAGIAFSKGQEVSLCCAKEGVVQKAQQTEQERQRTEQERLRTEQERQRIEQERQQWYGSVGCASCATQGVTVIATNTRSLSEQEAICETQHTTSALPLGQRIFKKTDSALRGHVIDELKALMDITGYRRAVYLPANPSKGRIIRQGIYYINGKPIHETDFSFDPEFPTRTSSLRERFPEAEAAGILMPDAESIEDIQKIIARYDDGQTLFAGAADLFAVLCPQGNTQHQEHTPETGGDKLILCGSTQSKPIDCGIPIVKMPRAVYDGEQEASAWLQAIPTDLTSLILTIPHRHRTGKAIAVHLCSVMGKVAKGLIDRHCPQQLIIEGGATAWATLQTLGWTQFDITRQVAPGVVQMRAANGTLVTLKPGSYPWGDLF